MAAHRRVGSTCINIVGSLRLCALVVGKSHLGEAVAHAFLDISFFSIKLSMNVVRMVYTCAIHAADWKLTFLQCRKGRLPTALIVVCFFLRVNRAAVEIAQPATKRMDACMVVGYVEYFRHMACRSDGCDNIHARLKEAADRHQRVRKLFAVVFCFGFADFICGGGKGENIVKICAGWLSGCLADQPRPSACPRHATYYA